MTPASRAAAWERESAAWPHREKSLFIKAGGYRWHVQRMGAGPTALLVHGTGASSHSFADLASLLSRSFNVIAPDLPGHGFTSALRWAPLSLGHVSREIGNLLETMGAKPALLVGHSAGAAIIIRMMSDQMVAPRLAVSVNGALQPFGGAAGLIYRSMAKALYFNGVAPLVFAQGARDINRVRRLIAQTGSTVPEANVRCYAALLRDRRHVAGALGMMAHWDLSDMTRAIRALDAAIVFAAGARDKAVPPEQAREAAALAPRGRAVTLPDIGHLAHEEAPEVIAGLIFDAAVEEGLIGETGR